MWQQVAMGLLGLCAGFAVASGAVALVIGLGTILGKMMEVSGAAERIGLAPEDRETAKPARRLGLVEVDQRSQRAGIGAGQDAVQDTGLGHRGDGRRGVAGREEFAQLGGDAFLGNRL